MSIDFLRAEFERLSIERRQLLYLLNKTKGLKSFSHNRIQRKRSARLWREIKALKIAIETHPENNKQK